MLQIRNRKLADPEIPVRMPRPLHVKIIAPIEGELHLLALQLVNNRPVINPPDRHPHAVALVVKPRPVLLDHLDVDGLNPEHLLRQQKIRQRLLLLWMNLHQDHVLRIMPTHNRPPQKVTVRVRIESAQERLQPLSAVETIQTKHVDVTLRQRHLIGIEGREGLQLHKLGLQLASSIPHEPKIHLDKHRMGRLIRNPKLRRNRSIRPRPILRTLYQLPDQLLPIASHPLQQRFGKETGSLRQPERHVSSASVINSPQECLIFLTSEASVELRSKEGNHPSAGVPPANLSTPLSS